MVSRAQKLAGVGSLTALLALTAACGSSASSSEGTDSNSGNASGSVSATPADTSVTGCDASKVTLRVAYEETGQTGVTLATKEMKAKYPGLTISGSASSITSYDQLTQTIVANRAAGIDDNVIQTGLDEVHFWVDTYHPAPLNTADLSSTYDKQYLSLGAVDGKDYVAPFQVDFPVLFVNTTLTAKAGLGANDLPKTSSQLIADAEKVKAVTGRAPVYYSPDSIPDWYAQALIQSGGGTFVNPNGTAGFDTATAEKALSVYTDLGKDGLEDPAPVAQAEASFLEGSLPYVLTATSATAEFAKDIGSKFQWSATTMPIPDGGTAKLPTGGNGWMILSSDRCTAAYASQFIADMLSPTVITASSQTYPYLPVDSAALGQILADDKNQPQMTFAESYTGTLTPWSGFPGTVTNQADTVIETMVEKLVRGATPQSVVPSAVAQIDSLVKKEG